MNNILYKSRIKKKAWLILFILLSIINGLIFICRDKFAYIPFAGYNTLYAPCDDNCIKKWSIYLNDYPAAELDKAKLIADSIIAPESKSSIDKILSLSGFLYKKFNRQVSSPDNNILKGSPVDQFNILCKDSSVQLWCGNFAAIFSYLCWAENIPCRTIEIMNPGDHHVINECYIDEYKQWIMVDVTSNQLLTMNANKKYLNLLDFKKELETGSMIQILRRSAGMIQTDTITTHSSWLQKYYKKQNPLYYYYRTDFSKINSGMDKFKRYVLPQSWYLINMEKKPDNFLFNIKQCFLILWLLTGLVLTVKTAKKWLTGSSATTLS